MQKQDVSFNDIYNTFSIDIILDADPLNEKLACWSTYSIITGIYRSNSKRLRDWISTPKANGYEAVHATIMNSTGQWVDLHIRSKRMDEIANKGYAAYWKYKELNKIDTSIDNWLQKTRLLLEDNKDDDTFGFITDFKKNLFSDEIFVFTPAGQMINMPSGATVLDFAYTIHTDLGNQCIGANINHRLVPMGHKIKSGDQVEIITSKIQTPIDEWYKYVTTARAKLRIGQAIKSFRKQYKKIGEEKLENYFKQLNIEKTKHNIYLLLTRSKIKGHIDLYYFIAKNLLGIKDIKEIMNPSESRLSWIRNFRLPFTKPRIESNSETTEESVKLPQTVEEKIYISDFNTLEYSISECCNPLPGDNVMGLIFPDEPIQIHLTNCEVAIRLMSQYGKNIVKAKWKQKAGITFLAGINIKAADSIGLINEITKLITDEFSINIRTFNLKSSEGLANMDITIYVVSTQVLKKLMTRLKKLKSIIKVTRLDKI
jgi:GTP pyrophosphokinase